MTATEYYDSLETRDPEAREAALMAELPDQVAHAKASAPGFADILANVDPSMVTSREALARLPVTRKADLAARQKDLPPLGGLASIAAGHACHLYMSPGPIFELDTARIDYWRSARALYASGFRAGDVAHNSFAYHLSPGGWILDGGLRALGCAVVPAGVGNTELQVQAIAQFRPGGYTGTPDYLKVLLDTADEMRVDASSITKGHVGGGALFPSLRQEYADRGIQVLQSYATADLGLIAYESPALEGMILDEHLIVEIVQPGTGEPVMPGEVGEVVATTLNPDYPLIRFATGDLSALLPGQSPCGRTNLRIKGWMGRADQAAKVKGLFVRPEQLHEVRARHPQILKARLVVTRASESDAMTLKCESTDFDTGLAAAVADSLREVTKMKGEVQLVAPGSLPNDGKVIDDLRCYD